MTYLKTYAFLRLTDWFIEKLHKILVKKGYYPEYTSRYLKVRNVFVSFTYLNSLGSM